MELELLSDSGGAEGLNRSLSVSVVAPSEAVEGRAVELGVEELDRGVELGVEELG